MSHKLSITALSKEEIQKRIEEIRSTACFSSAEEILTMGEILGLKWVLEHYDTGYYEKYESKVGLVVSGGTESQS